MSLRAAWCICLLLLASRYPVTSQSSRKNAVFWDIMACLWPKTLSEILLVTENQLLNEDLLESAVLYGTELADKLLYMNCVQEHNRINGPGWKSISGCPFNLDLLTGLGSTDHTRWSWQIFFLGEVVQCRGNALAEPG